MNANKLKSLVCEWNEEIVRLAERNPFTGSLLPLADRLWYLAFSFVSKHLRDQQALDNSTLVLQRVRIDIINNNIE